MATFLRARVKETTTTTGTGTMQLLGAAPGYQTFLAPFGNGARCYYMVVDGSAWEYGLGTINSSSQLARTLVIASTSGAGGITLAAGTKNVYCAIPPECCLNNGTLIFTDNATTPSIRNGRVFVANNSSSTTITNFVDGIDGQEIVIYFNNGNTTIQNNANVKLAGAVNFVGTAADTLSLLNISGVWYEKSRSVN